MQIHKGQSTLRCWALRYACGLAFAALDISSLVGQTPSARPEAILSRPVPISVRASLFFGKLGLGAVLCGLYARASGRRFRAGLMYGAGGGAITGVGRQLVGSKSRFAGQLGRLIHSAGLAIGAAGMRDTVELPIAFGPIIARWRPRSGRWPRFRINAASLVTVIAAAAKPGAQLDWSETLWSGAVVIGQERPSASGRNPSASSGFGTIRLPYNDYLVLPVSGISDARRLDVAHEAIHVLQMDAMHEWIGYGIESSILQRSSFGRAFGRWFEVGVIGPTVGAAVQAPLAYKQRPVEIEAWWLSEGHPVGGDR